MARPQINIRVDEERKQRWKQAADESPEYDGLTHLIRLAVEKELAEDESPDVGASQAPVETASSDMLREVKGNTERIDNGISDVKARLRQIEERVGAQADFSLRAAVRETVPEDEENWLTAGQIAARLDAKKSDVQEILDSLHQEGEIREIPAGVWEGQDEPAWTTMEEA